MRHILILFVSLSLSVLFSHGIHADTERPLRALLLTSPGVYHNYEQQMWTLAHGIADHANVRFDVSLADSERWKTTDFSAGYDVLIYNICMADNKDGELIENMRRQTEQLGVPALVIHCTMHSFRETELWWPLYGLQTREHESLRPLPQIHEQQHPILQGIPADWEVANDELYINLEFSGQSLLSSVGEDGESHTTAWLSREGTTAVFGTTLGHSEETMSDPVYHRLVANALLYVTNMLTADGTPKAGQQSIGDGMDIFETFSAPEGTHFLGEAGKECAYRRLALAATPCYLGCILNPFEWNEATRDCKRACESDLPAADELITACTTQI
jgi:trehalose utilization protein